MKELKLTPQEALDIFLDSSEKYYNLEKNITKEYYGDMTTEYHYDVIFENRITKDRYVIENLLIVEGSIKWFEQDDFEESFLDNCDRHNIDSFTAKRGTWNNKPRFEIENKDYHFDVFNMYIAQYNSDSGSPSDNEIIGIYNTKAEAEKAKAKYIEYESGPLPTQAQLDLEGDGYTVEEWQDDFDRLDECVWVQKVINKY